MKRIDAVIRREKFESVKKALDALGLPGLMVMTFHGCGTQGGIQESHGGRRFKVPLLPKVLLTIFAPDEKAGKIIATIAKAARTGKIGDGKIFVAQAETAVRIRTGEAGEAAL